MVILCLPVTFQNYLLLQYSLINRFAVEKPLLKNKYSRLISNLYCWKGSPEVSIIIYISVTITKLFENLFPNLEFNSKAVEFVIDSKF
jgi:hypothetical protein